MIAPFDRVYPCLTCFWGASSVSPQFELNRKDDQPASKRKRELEGLSKIRKIKMIEMIKSN